jgi:hypothetical protein
MIDSSISHAASAMTAPLSLASGHALQGTDPSARHTPAARIELSAEARGRSHAPDGEVMRDKAEQTEKSKSSDPRMMQVLWSKSLWKTNPSGTSDTYVPPKRSRPTPLRSVSSPERSAHDVAPRGQRPARTERAERASRNRERLQAYDAVKRDTAPSEALLLGAKSERTAEQVDTKEGAVNAAVQITTSPRGRVAPARS